jgi:hypothetical protein
MTPPRTGVGDLGVWHARPVDAGAATDRDESVEIRSFLAEHGYKVKNVQNWTFLASNPSR